MNFDQVVDRLVGQFDTTTAIAASVLNERRKQLIVEGKWGSSEETLATSVAGQASYAIPADIVDIREVRIGEQAYTWVGDVEIDMLGNDTSDDGFWAGAAFDSSGARLLQLDPAPTVSGSAITALLHSIPSDLTYGSTQALGIPDDFVRYLRAGAQADLYEEVDERFDLAQSREQVFQTGVGKLRARSWSQVSPASVTRVRVSGYDFDL